MSKATDDTNGAPLCMDKTTKEIYAEEIALFVHQSLFHGKTWVVYKEPIKGGGLFKILVPTTSMILKDIITRTTKNKGNVEYYGKKVMKNKKKIRKNQSSFVSEDDEDDEDKEKGERRIIGDGEVL
jgi:hypothetical protein